MRAPSVETLFAPLDAVRSLALRSLGPSFARWLTDRERRVNAVALVGMSLSLALTVIAPLWLLALGPVLLGAAHLASDARYLVLWQGLHRRWSAWALLGAPLLAGALTPLGSRAFALSSVGAVLLAAPKNRWRFAVSMSTALAVCAAFFALPRAAELVVAHAHNFIAVLLWLAWRPRAGRGHWLVASAFVAGNVALLSGALDPVIAQLAGLSRGPEGLTLGGQMMALAPFPTRIDLSRRMVLSFAFSQSVHYALWLRAIPEVARRSKTTRSFRQSARALEADAGRVAVWVIAAACVGLALWASMDLLAAREGYLRFALFHGYLEISVALWLFCEGRRPLAVEAQR
jgi:hypothetical protein